MASRSPGAYVVARLVDLGTDEQGPKVRLGHSGPNGSGGWGGYELHTYTVDGVGSFQVHAQYVATCSSANSCELSETGKVLPEAGTGAYAGMTGSLSIHGPFAGGDILNQPYLWISQVSGTVCVP